MFFFDTCKSERFTLYAEIKIPNIDDWDATILDWVWRCDVTTSNSKYFRLCNATCIDYVTLKRFFWLLQEINKRRNMEIHNHKPYSRCRVWRCDVTTSNSIQDGGALVVNILVFDLRVQIQHCTYQRKTLLFALIKVSAFIFKKGEFMLQFLFKNDPETSAIFSDNPLISFRRNKNMRDNLVRSALRQNPPEPACTFFALVLIVTRVCFSTLSHFRT